jgi:hypothetical protein
VILCEENVRCICLTRLIHWPVEKDFHLLFLCFKFVSNGA